MASAIAGPSSLPSGALPSSLSSFRAFADSLAEAKDATLADRLSTDAESGHLGTAIRFARVCSERAARAEGAEVDGLSSSSRRVTQGMRQSLDEDYGEEDRLQWILEARTWELIHHLCADRYLHHPTDDQGSTVSFKDEEDEYRQHNFYQTPVSAIRDILDRNRGLRELRVSRI